MAKGSMSYNLKAVVNPHYAHFIITGSNTRENVSSYLREIMSECRERNYSSILIEERLDGPRLGMLEVFQIVSDSVPESVGTLVSIAYVDENAEGDLMNFAETVAINRSLPVKVFPSIPEAKKWLADRCVR